MKISSFKDRKIEYDHKPSEIRPHPQNCKVLFVEITCLAMALAVFLLSPVSSITSSPMRFRVYMAKCASVFTVSATAIMAIISSENMKIHRNTREKKFSLKSVWQTHKTIFLVFNFS